MMTRTVPVRLVPIHQGLVRELHRHLQPSELYLHNDDDRRPLPELRARLAYAEQERSPDNPEMVWLYGLIQSGEELAGVVEVGIFPDDYGELGFLVFLPFQRKGLAVRAIRLALRDVWSRWPSTSIHAFTRKSNVAAPRTLRRTGFEKQTASERATLPRDEFLYVLARGSAATPASS